MDLDGVELEGIELGYAEFMEFAQADCSGFLDPEDFGSGFEIKADGLYLKPLPVGIDLLPRERAALTQHPRGKPDEPVLPFPFRPRELKAFFDWAARVGHDVPIDEDALCEVITAQKTVPALIAANSARAANESDASLGAYLRQRNQTFSKRNRDSHDAREAEHQEWRRVAAEIQREREKPASLRHLAELVKKRLNLPDKEETIRKRLAKSEGSG